MAGGDTLWTLIKLIITISIFGGFAYAVSLAVKAVNAGVEVAVKTDRRAMTMEETEDRIQAGIRKGWKASTFEVPWMLSKGTNLSGSSHDKSKAEWEKKRRRSC
ncbi:hypothetical protein T439DRAFT_331566 [Meredithblackwellia eburnea MCA 4105]